MKRREDLMIQMHYVMCYEGDEHFFAVQNGLYRDMTDPNFVGSVKFKNCIVTNNRVVYYKTLLKSLITEFKETSIRYSNDYDRVCNTWGKDSSVAVDTFNCQLSYLQTLMKRIASCTNRLISLDVEVTDELAHVCLNYANTYL